MVDVGYVNALVRERAGYARSNPARVIAVDEELARVGFCVNSEGRLVAVDRNRRAVPAEDRPGRRPARERAVPKPLETAVDKELPDEQQA